MSTNASLTPNPGGQLSPDSILGRDELIGNLWHILHGRSIYMNDLRRIGKTQIMVKMHAEPPSGWHSVKRDLGGFHTAAEFATRVYLDAASVLAPKNRILRGMSDLLGNIAGAEIAGIIKLPDGKVAPWKEVLFRTFTDLENEMLALETETARPARMVFFWDEIPFLLDNISRRESPAVAMEVLDVLRAFGQDHDHIRLVLTGSIGIHHVLAALRAEGHNHSPFNRMEHVSPGPLTPLHAHELARRLLAGATQRCDEPEDCAATIAEAVGHVAFYIHKLVSRLPAHEPITPAAVERCLLREIAANERDDWDFAHYRNRLETYYRSDTPLALAVLDTVASAAPATPPDFAALRRAAATSVADFNDDEKLRALLKLLCRDHYLVRDEHGAYRFYLELVRRWWHLDRALGPAA